MSLTQTTPNIKEIINQNLSYFEPSSYDVYNEDLDLYLPQELNAYYHDYKLAEKFLRRYEKIENMTVIEAFIAMLHGMADGSSPMTVQTIIDRMHDLPFFKEYLEKGDAPINARYGDGLDAPVGNSNMIGYLSYNLSVVFPAQEEEQSEAPIDTPVGGNDTK